MPDSRVLITVTLQHSFISASIILHTLYFFFSNFPSYFKIFFKIDLEIVFQVIQKYPVVILVGIKLYL